MDAYQDSRRSAPRATDSESSRSEIRSLTPTPADLAQWKEESDRFLHDVRMRLNDILSELDRNQMVQPTAQVAPQPPADSRNPETEPNTESLSALPAQTEDGRISALKAQLARKLHDLEHTADGTFDAEVRK
jgi:hypothetical protein